MASAFLRSTFEPTAFEVTKVYTLVASGSTYFQTGYTVTFPLGRAIVVTQGVYSQIGKNASLFYTNAFTINYALTGYSANLYKTIFFYTDSEVIYVPQTIQTSTLDYENRTITVPAKVNIEELAEYRAAVAESRLRVPA